MVRPAFPRQVEDTSDAPIVRARRTAHRIMDEHYGQTFCPELLEFMLMQAYLAGNTERAKSEKEKTHV